MLATPQDIVPPANPGYARTYRPFGVVLAGRSEERFYHTVNRINADYHIANVHDFTAWGGSGVFTWTGQVRDVRTLSSPAMTAVQWGCVANRDIYKVTTTIGFRRSGDGGNAPSWRSASTDDFASTINITGYTPGAQTLHLPGQFPWINWNSIPPIDPASPQQVTAYSRAFNVPFGPAGSGITYQFDVAFEPSPALDNGLLDCKFQLYYMDIRFDYSPL
jgi:hypothetical protein